MLTKKQLQKFVEIRNNSPYKSNFQFSTDCESAGFSVAELGHAARRDDGSYVWNTPHGHLIEHPGGKMELRD